MRETPEEIRLAKIEFHLDVLRRGQTLLETECMELRTMIEDVIQVELDELQNAVISLGGKKNT